jgi:hypothetical protein
MAPPPRWSRWSDLFVANWPMKLTALALAAVLWVGVAAEEPATGKIPITLRVLAPAGHSLSRPLPAVSGVFAGSARELLKLYASPPVITVAVPDTIDSVYTVQLTTGQIEMGNHVKAQAQAIEPRSITVVLKNAAGPTITKVSTEAGPVSERVLMGVPVTMRDDRAGWSSEPPAVIVTVRGPTARLARLTRDSIEVAARPKGTGRPETVRLEVRAPTGIDAAATPDTAVVQRRGGV